MSMVAPVNPATITKLEKAYMPRKRGETYTALEDVDFQWSRYEITEFINLWNAGVSLTGLSHRFRRSQTDIAVLILDLRLKGRIEPRERGLNGI